MAQKTQKELCSKCRKRLVRYFPGGDPDSYYCRCWRKQLPKNKRSSVNVRRHLYKTNGPEGEEGGSRIDHVPSPTRLTESEIEAQLKEGGLTKREIEILFDRHIDNLTLEEVAKTYGFKSHQRAGLEIGKILEKARKAGVDVSQTTDSIALPVSAPQQYQYHQRVWNHLYNKWGVVLGFLGGPHRRYRIAHGRTCYTVPEWYLDPAMNKSNDNVVIPLPHEP